MKSENIKLNDDKLDCVDCMKSKATRDTFTGHFEPVNSIGEAIHSDIGFINVEGFEEHNKFIIFLDQYSHYLVTFILHKNIEFGSISLS